MNSRARTLALALTLAPVLAAPALLHAAAPAKAEASSGVVLGRVMNAATKNYLASVEIRDEATGLSTTSDVDGSFRLTLPVGQRTLSYSYTGLDTQKQTVTVAAGDNTLREVALSSGDYGAVMIMDEVVVASEKEGRAASIASQKQADYMMNVISSDEFQNVAGGNVGDFLRNVPGISIEYSGPDPRWVSIRGMDPNMTGVSVNGMRAASASSANSNRRFEFDQTSLQDVEAIEIFKTPTAAIDADSGAGSVNIISKSAFKLKGRRVSYSALGNAISSDLTIGKTIFPEDSNRVRYTHKIRPGGTFAYSESFLGNKLGVAFTANYNEYYVNSHSYTTTYGVTGSISAFAGTRVDADNGLHLRSLGYGINPILTQRTSFSLNLDYRLSSATTLWLRAQANTSQLDGGGRTIDVNVNAPAATAPTTNGAAAGWSSYSVTALGNNVTSAAEAGASTSSTYAHVGGEFLDKVGADTKFSWGSNTKVGPWKIDTGFSATLSTNHYRNHGYMPVPQVDLYLRGINFRIDQPKGAWYPSITQLSGPDMYNLSNYVSRAGTSATSRVAGTNVGAYPDVTIANTQYAPFQLRNGRRAAGKDKILTGKFDVKRSFATALPHYVQFGGSYRQQERIMDRAGQARWLYVGPDGIAGNTDDYTTLDLGQFKSTKIKDDFAAFHSIPYYDLNAINQYFISNPNLFREDVAYRIETEGANDRKITEKVSAIYPMDGIQIKRLNVLLGVRGERTYDWGRGAAVDNDGARDEAVAELLAYCQSLGYSSITATPTAVRSAFRANSAKISTIRYAKRIESTQTYDDLFPNVQLKYNFTKDFMLRASYNKSIGRQDFGNLMPGYSVTASDVNGLNTVTITNIKLKPVYFDNYDLSAEYYLKQGGILSASVYQKDIKNYTINSTETITAGMDYGYDLSGYIGDTLVRKVNAGNARHQGVEFTYSQNLKVLSRRLAGLSFYTGYTYQKAKSNASYGGTGTLPQKFPVVNAVPRMFNASLRYRYQKFNSSISYNWKSAYANAIATNSVTPTSYMITYWDARGTADLSLSYDYHKAHSLFLEVKNVTNTPCRQYVVNQDHYKYVAVNGATIYLGVKGQF